MKSRPLVNTNTAVTRLQQSKSFYIRSFQLPCTECEILVATEFFEGHGSAGVELVGADADFCSKTELSTIGEAGGGVPEYTGGVDFELEFLCGFFVFGDDAVGVVGAVVVDVLNGGVEIIDDLYREDVIEILSAPVSVRCRNRPVVFAEFQERFVAA